MNHFPYIFYFSPYYIVKLGSKNFNAKKYNLPVFSHTKTTIGIVLPPITIPQDIESLIE